MITSLGEQRGTVMNKDPAFLFYSSDFLTGVADLTMEERGKYITLMCLQHQHGHLTEKTIWLSLGCKSVSEIPDVIGKFTKDENGLYFNERLESEIEKRSKYSDSRRLNGSQGGRPKKITDSFETKQKPYAKPSGYPYAEPYVNHSENENENENRIKNVDRIEDENNISFVNKENINNIVCASSQGNCVTTLLPSVPVPPPIDSEPKVNKVSRKPRIVREPFVIPTLDEVRAYCLERKNSIDPEYFIDYYTNNGWVAGRKKMTEWKFAIRTWERNNYNNQNNRNKNQYEAKTIKTGESSYKLC